MPTSSKSLTSSTESIPVVDIGSLRGGSRDLHRIGAALDRNRAAPRCDDTDLAAVSGSYGDYLLNKVSKVFPQLKAKVL